MQVDGSSYPLDNTISNTVVIEQFSPPPPSFTSPSAPIAPAAASPTSRNLRRAAKYANNWFWFAGLPAEAWFSYLFWSLFPRLAREVFYFVMSEVGASYGLLYYLILLPPLLLFIQPLAKKVMQRYGLVPLRVLIVVFVAISYYEQVYVRVTFVALALMLVIILEDLLITHPMEACRIRLVWSQILGLLFLAIIRFFNLSVNPLWDRLFYAIAALLVGLIASFALLVEFLWFFQKPYLVPHIYLLDNGDKQTALDQDVEETQPQPLESTLSTQAPQMVPAPRISKKRKALRVMVKIISLVMICASLSSFLFLVERFYTQTTVIPLWSGLKQYPYGVYVIAALLLGIIIAHFQSTVFLYVVTLISLLVFSFTTGTTALISGLVFGLLVPSWIYLFIYELGISQVNGVFSISVLVSFLYTLASIGVYAEGLLPAFGNSFGGRNWKLLVIAAAMMSLFFPAVFFDRLQAAILEVGTTTGVALRRSLLAFFIPRYFSKDPSFEKLRMRHIFKFVSPSQALLITLAFIVGAVFLSAIMIRSYESYVAPSTNNRYFNAMTVNVFQGYTYNGGSNWDELIDYINKYDVHVVALQESDISVPTGNGIDYAEYVSNSAHMYSYLGAPSQIGTLNCAVLSRLRILYSDYIILPFRGATSQARAACHVVTDFNGVGVHYFTVHIEPTSASDALLQIATVVGYADEVIRQDPQTPVIIMGDFNFQPGSPQIELLFNNGFKSAYGETHNGTHTVTWRSKAGEQEKIDFIFYKNLQVLNAAVIEGDLSDHYPVIAKLTTEEYDEAEGETTRSLEKKRNIMLL